MTEHLFKLVCLHALYNLTGARKCCLTFTVLVSHICDTPLIGHLHCISVSWYLPQQMWI